MNSFYDVSEKQESEDENQDSREYFKIVTVTYENLDNIQLIQNAQLKETLRLINKFRRKWKIIAYKIFIESEMKNIMNSPFQGTLKEIVIQILKDPKYGNQAIQYLLEKIMNQYVKVIENEFLQELLNHFFRMFYESIIKNPPKKVYCDFSKLMKSDLKINTLFQICQPKNEQICQIETRSKKIQ